MDGATLCTKTIDGQAYAMNGLNLPEAAVQGSWRLPMPWQAEKRIRVHGLETEPFE